MFRYPIAKRSAGGGCLALVFVLVLTHCESAFAIEVKSLLAQGFKQRIVDGRSTYVNDLINQSYDVRPNGSARQTFFAYGPTLDDAGQPKIVRFAQYVVVTDANDKVVKVIDRFDIPHMGTGLKQTDKGVSFIDHHNREVTIRKDGSRRVVNNRGKGPGFETYYSGMLRMRFDSEGKVTHRYGYDTVVQGQGAFTTKKFELKEFIAANSKGAHEYWGKTATDKETGKQTWMLKNGKDGKTVALKGVHRITVANDKSIVIEHTTESFAAGKENLIASKTAHNLDGARIETKTFKKPDGSIRESTAVFGKQKKPSYLVESIFSMKSGERKLRSAAIIAGKLDYTSKDGKLWAQTPKENEKPQYFTGNFRILADGSYYQTGFETDAQGERAKKEGKLAPARTFFIDTSGMSVEIPSEFAGKTDRTSARIVRDRQGDVLQTVNVHGRKTGFEYSQKKDVNGKHIIRQIRDHSGVAWKTDDEGRTWYESETGRRRQSSEPAVFTMDREIGAIRYEDDRYVTHVTLDGNTTFEKKFSKSRRVYLADGRISAITNELGNEITFTYKTDGALGGFKSSKDFPFLASDKKLHVVGVDWNGDVTFETRPQNYRGHRVIATNSGVTKVFDQNNRITSISHPSGFKCTYAYEKGQLSSVTRRTRNGSQTFRVGTDGKGRIAETIRKARVAEQILRRFVMDNDGTLSVHYARHSDKEKPLIQTFLPDGRRKIVDQALSSWWFDMSDRVTDVLQGTDNWKSLIYSGDDNVPTDILTQHLNWTRSEKAHGKSDDGTPRYEWTASRGGQKWTGLVQTVGLNFRFPGSKTVWKEKVGDDWRHHMENGVKYWTDGRGRITEAGGTYGERYRYDRDETGKITAASKVKGHGEHIKLLDVIKVGKNVAEIKINKRTGQPIFVANDGIATIHLPNGLIITRNASGDATGVELPKVFKWSDKEKTTDGIVSAIKYDSDSGSVVVHFSNGNTARFGNNGERLIQNAQGRLVRTVWKYRTTSFDYGTDGRLRLITIIQTNPFDEVPAKEKVTTHVLERTDTGKWKRRGTDHAKHVFDEITLNANSGELIRRRDNTVEHVNAFGDRHTYRLGDSGFRSLVAFDAVNNVNNTLDSRRNMTSFFRTDTMQCVLINFNNVETATARRDGILRDGIWITNYDTKVDYHAKPSFTLDGDQVWTHKDVKITLFADGSWQLRLADGSKKFRNADHTTTTFTPAAVGDIKMITVESNGTKTSFFSNGTTHTQRPNELIVRKFDAAEKEMGAFQGLLHVSRFGTLTEVNRDANTVRIFPRYGGRTKVFKRKPALNGQDIHYLDGRRSIELSDYDAREPHSIGPPVGFNASHRYSPLWTVFQPLNSPDAHTPKPTATKTPPTKPLPAKPSSAGPPDLAAAEKGDAVAQYKTGQHYFQKRDFAQAKVWFEKAAAQGNAGAKVLLRVVDRELKKKGNTSAE